jgi:hypothetical protein
VVEGILPDDPPGQSLDDGADPGRAEAFVELAPADDTLVGGELQKVVISPAGIAAKNFEFVDLHRNAPSIHGSRANIVNP